LYLLFKYLRNSIFGYCPDCGMDTVFYKWSRMKEQCSNCGAWFVEGQGDHWFFLLFIDRGLFIFPIIVGYYFDLEPRLLIGLSLLLMIIFIAATPFRLGLSLGLEYFFRKKIK